MAQAIAGALGISVPRAGVMLRAYASEQLGSDRAKIREALQEPLSEWLSAVTECLQGWKDVRGDWSPNIHLCGGLGALKDLERVVAATRWLEIAPFPYTPQVRLWDGSNVDQVVDHTDRRWQVDSLTPLALAAWMLRDRGPASHDGILRASLEI